MFHHSLFLFRSTLSVSFIEPVIREKLMSGKVLIQWRHSLCAEVAKERYMASREVIRQAHAELANISFNEGTEDSDDVTSSHSDNKQGEDVFFDYLLLLLMSENLLL